MLVPFLPEQVVEKWEVIGAAIGRALPPATNHTPHVMNNILRAILAEEAILWGWQDDGETDFYIFLLTTEITDGLAGIRSLLIYSVSALSPAPKRVWEEGAAFLRKYAKGRNCQYVTAYTNLEQLADFLSGNGWDAQFTLLTLKV